MTSRTFLYLLSPVHSATATPRPVNPHLFLLLLAPFPPVSKCSPLKRWCPICHTRAKRDHALLFSITEFSSCQLRWDRRRSRWVSVSVINQHEIFSFEYTHHLLLLLLLLCTCTPTSPKKKKGKKKVKGMTWLDGDLCFWEFQGGGVFSSTAQGTWVNETVQHRRVFREGSVKWHKARLGNFLPW